MKPFIIGNMPTGKHKSPLHQLLEQLAALEVETTKGVKKERELFKASVVDKDGDEVFDEAAIGNLMLVVAIHDNKDGEGRVGISRQIKGSKYSPEACIAMLETLDKLHEHFLEKLIEGSILGGLDN